MFGINSIEIIYFIKQLGLALAGASCLWGLYFHIKAKRINEDSEKEEIFHEISEKMLGPLSVGLIFTITGWLLFDFLHAKILFAHEGISIMPEIEASGMAFEIITPFFLGFLAVFAAGLIWRKFNRDAFYKYIHYFYITEFILASIIISFPAWSGSWGSEQIFLAGHGFHSILTLGTVLVLDFLFILTKYSEEFERHIYPTLPTVSKVIWIGLAIDFASVGFVFDQAIANTPKFIFMQTVIAVVILNGAFLSGPITERLINSVRYEVKKLSPSWNKIMTVSGSVSAASWITVTFTDFIENIQLSYPTLLGLYIAFLVAAYLVYEVLEHYKVGSRW